MSAAIDGLGEIACRFASGGAGFSLVICGRDGTRFESEAHIRNVIYKKQRIHDEWVSPPPFTETFRWMCR